jgi:hypothetical protein
MEVTLPLNLLIEIALFLLATGGMWALLRSEIRDLRRQVEEHGPDVKKINPLETRFEQFEKQINDAVTGLRSDMKDVAAGLQELALAVARRTAPPNDYSREDLIAQLQQLVRSA